MQKVVGSNPISRSPGTRSKSGFRPSVCLSCLAVAPQFPGRVRFGSGYLASGLTAHREALREMTELLHHESPSVRHGRGGF
jgi:hypothetical protein